MSARSPSDRIAFWYGGMARLVKRTKAPNASAGIGFGASFAAPAVVH
jgi:hypothetical protein